MALVGLLCAAEILAEQPVAAAEQSGVHRTASREVCNADLICKEHAQKAGYAVGAGDRDLAIKEFTLAYERIPYPIFLFQIARLYHEQKQSVLAIQHYERYIAIGEDPTLVHQSRRFLSELQPEATAPPPPPVANPATVRPTITPRPEIPLYRRWWLWTPIGVVAAGIIVTGVVVGTWPSPPSGSPKINVLE